MPYHSPALRQAIGYWSRSKESERKVIFLFYISVLEIDGEVGDGKRGGREWQMDGGLESGLMEREGERETDRVREKVKV